MLSSGNSIGGGDQGMWGTYLQAQRHAGGGSTATDKPLCGALVKLLCEASLSLCPPSSWQGGVVPLSWWME